VVSKKPNEATTKELPVVVIGGGWSGLSCAVSLAAKGLPVLLLESARQLGGRARGVKLKHFSDDIQTTESEAGFYSDNGHHIMLGAYHHVLDLLKLLHIRENDVLLRLPLELNLYTAGRKKYTLKAPLLPAPLHLIMALLRHNGFSLIDRLKALRMVIRLATIHYTLQEDISVKELLMRYSQSQPLIEGLWEPLCLAALNTPVDTASAQVFLFVLRDSFSRYRSDSDVLLFKINLTHFLSVPARDFIQRHGGEVHLESKVTHLQITNNQITAIGMENETIKCRHVVIATPADITRQLLRGSSTAYELIPAYKYEPICTVYLQYPETVRLPTLMTGFINATSHWAFEHSVIHQPIIHQQEHDNSKTISNTSFSNSCSSKTDSLKTCVIATVISGPGQHMKLDKQNLANQVHRELQEVTGQLPAFSQYQVIKEKKATFSCQVGIQKNRPGCTTPVKGLYLAGDYTDTDYPATLEGAVKSGFTAANVVSLILSQQI
jgi:squalene-associated FAD-dependent desaturase